jgi:hypothetical protein
MAKFELQLPDSIMKDIKTIESNSDRIFGAMTKAGAEVVMKNVRANVPKSFLKSDIMHCLKITRVYKTPSDKGINTKVGFYGYFTNEKGQKVPAPLVCNVFEYGRSNKPFKKHPFMRKSFRKAQIEQAMLAAQKKESGGLLDE